MKNLIRFSALGLAVAGLATVFQNCGQPGSIVAAAPEIISEVPIPGTQYAVQKLPSNKFICEPFGNSNGGSAQGGLKAELAYVDPTSGLSANAKNAFSSLEYFNNMSPFVKVTTPIYLSQVNVPTRNFDRGFMLSDGTYLSDTNGNRLIEWFALKMQSVLKLSDSDAEGYYELATISDDGSVVYLGEGSSQQKIIDNDGAHSARMKCASQTVSFNRNSRIPLTYFYNQGPRTEIANVLIWRFAGNNQNPQAHQLCDTASQKEFWDPSNSAEGSHWTRLKNDGFKILNAGNFELPNSQVNPCATQNTNLIAKAEFSSFSNNVATLDLEFLQAANIKAQLYRVSGNQKDLIQSYDLSAQVRDRASITLPALNVNAEHSLEVLLEMPGSGTKVLNEVRFQIVVQ